MFQPGDKVVCVNADMGNIGEVLIKGKTYTVKEYLSLEEYEKQNPDFGWWLKVEVREEWKCGVVYLKESLGADRSNLAWLANRFKSAGNE